ncbi:MFS transporter [Streptomyces virginiae]|uniref:MFS transporter n=1 Tax=Streptomyces virginiae TaxID=1961 RepID=UPI0036E03448
MAARERPGRAPALTPPAPSGPEPAASAVSAAATAATARARTAGGPDTTDGAPRQGKLAVLRMPAYRWFFTAQAGSALGDFAVAPALAFAVLDLTGSVRDLGLVLAARTVPVVLFMLIGGVVADRLPRHLVMLGADAARCAVQAATAAVILTGRADIGLLMALQAVHGTAGALSTPAVSRLLQEVVPPPLRPSANALRSISHSAAMILGPLLAIALVLHSGPGWAIAADAATFALSACCLARLGLPRAAGGAAGGGRMLAELRLGWHEFSSRTWVWSIILMASLTNMFFAVFTVLGPALSEDRLGGRGAWGVLLASFGAGAVAGGAAALVLRPRRPLRAGILAVALLAAPALGLALLPPLIPLVAAAAFLGGVGLMVFNPLWETVLQAEIPPEVLSRVSAYEWFGSYAAQPLGMVLAGPLAAGAGARTTLLWVGLAQLAVSCAPMAVRQVRTMPRP